MERLTQHGRLNPTGGPADGREAFRPALVDVERERLLTGVDEPVFADLGFADASEHLIKAGLVVRIDRIIRARNLTQAGAAELMGIDQPKVSAMLAGQSVERLMRFLSR